ncbi:glutathione S-transferase T3-like [Eutrema salsugineum]|uniref:glutathione S-transferase T3-like n=1 Tax=Eutrema salsugineum TaxID=72664 RepID=UPI000CED0E44|nr:glutathione S-transferase T3-like [Eutrema salsugineum]
MDSPNLFTTSQGFVNLLTSQQEITYSFPQTIDLGSSELPQFSSQSSDDPSVPVEDRRQRRPWTAKEDVVLISAWLNTSKDPVVGNEQKLEAFWKRIQKYFNSTLELSGPEARTASQCKQRWGRLNDQVCKFVGCFEAAVKDKRSGQNDNDVLKAAHEIFFNDYQAKFTLEHAWRELRFDQKWCSKGSRKRRKTDESASSQEEVVLEDDSEPRPIGVKAAKSKKSGSKLKAEVQADKTLKHLQIVWEIKQSDMEMKQRDLELQDKLSSKKLLEKLLTKPEPLTETEMKLKDKLINDLL